MSQRSSTSIPILIGGDTLVLALVTIVGFATHAELGSAGLRLLTTFLPLGAAWALVSPWLGLYHPSTICQPRRLYRPALAAVIAAPLAAWLRGLWLNQPILPVFIAVLAGTTALAITVWRALWQSITPKQVPHG